jgi:hypothetical protein
MTRAFHDDFPNGIGSGYDNRGRLFATLYTMHELAFERTLDEERYLEY